MKIYIAGKITGDPNYKMKFRMTAKHIQELYPLAVILNPAELPEGLTPKDYMRLCFGMIDAADILFALPDAEESKGAKLEIAYCRYVGKGVLEWNESSETAVCERPAAYEDIKAPFTENTMINLAAQALGVEPSRLRELAEADKDGRVVVQPCKVGQRVFALMDTDKHISECEVKRIGMGNGIGFIVLEPIGARGRGYGVALNGFGKTVFLTREEAEKVLKERAGKKDGV